MVKKFKVLESETILDDFIKVKKDKLKLPNDKTATYYSVETKEVVSILALTKKKEVLICEQYRHPVGKVTYECPAGLVEEGEDLEAAARRELEEETGYTAKNMKKLGAYYPTAGVSNMKIHYFLATGLKKNKKQKLDPSEFINVQLMPLEELTKKIIENEYESLSSSFLIMLYHKLEKDKK